MRDVADVDGLELHLRARQRHHRKEVQERREPVQEIVLSAEDHRRLENRPVEPGRRDGRFGLALAREIAARPHGIGVERAHLHEPRHAGRPACGDEAPRDPDVDVGERLRARLVEDSDKIDHCRRAGRERGYRRRVADVGFEYLDGRQKEQVARDHAPACRNDDAVSTIDERGDDVAADEAGSPDDHDSGERHGQRAGTAAESMSMSVAVPRGGTVPSRVRKGM